MRRGLIIGIALVGIGVVGWFFLGRPEATRLALEPGARLDSLHGVVVFHNGHMGHVIGRNVVDGYNVGLRYQCVEFVKRYYLEHYQHRMPNSYGHAKDLFDHTLADGVLNVDRGLLQVTNPSSTKPAVGDLLILDAWRGNAYGHVAIVSAVNDDELEVIQQNTGSTRQQYDLDHDNGRWTIDNDRVLGRLRMP